jgi:hypothetical protein
MNWDLTELIMLIFIEFNLKFGLMGYKIDQLDDLVTIALNFHLKFNGLRSSNIYGDT